MTKTLRNKLLVALLAVLMCIVGFFGVTLGGQGVQTANAASYTTVQWSIYQEGEKQTLYLGSSQHEAKSTETKLASGSFNTTYGWYSNMPSEYESTVTHAVIENEITPQRFHGVFEDFSALKEISGLENFNLTELETWTGEDFTPVCGESIFKNCSSLEKVDLSDFDVSNLKSFSNMFFGCSSLKRIDLSTWTNDGVWDFDSMFRACTNLRSVIFGNFKYEYNSASRVNTPWSSVYTDCPNLKMIDYSLLDISETEGASADAYDHFFSSYGSAKELSCVKISESVAEKLNDGTIAYTTENDLLAYYTYTYEGSTVNLGAKGAGMYSTQYHLSCTYDNGFCTGCDGYQPAVYSNNSYYISNGGQMFWFAGLVNGTLTDGTEQNRLAYAVVTNDIDLENREWTPIGNMTANTEYDSSLSQYYGGDFLGRGYTISNFSINSTDGYANRGFFGVLKDAIVWEFTLDGKITVTGGTTDRDIGGVAGTAYGTTRIEEVHSLVDITVDVTSGGNIAGVLGEMNGNDVASSILGCSYGGTMLVKNAAVGTNVAGIIGYIWTNNSAVVNNNHFFGSITTNISGSDTERPRLSGLLGYVRSGTTTLTNNLVSGSLNAPNVINDTLISGFGWIREGKLNNTWNHTISNNYYCGDLIIWLDDITGNTYNVDMDEDELDGMLMRVSADALASGEVAYLLNNSVSGGTTWKQTLGNDAYPALTAADVVYTYTYCNGDTLYTNDSTLDGTSVEHAFSDNGFCTNEGCDGYQSANWNSETGYYEIYNGGQMFWYAQEINSGNYAYKGMLMNNVDLENRVWTPIGNGDEIDGENKSPCFNGTFDGQGYAISGLNVQANSWNAGLFGCAAGNSTIKNIVVYGDITVNASGIGNIGLIGFGRHVTVENVISHVDISFADSLAPITDATAMRNIGGIMGYEYSLVNMKKCAYYGTIDLGAHAAQYVGGLIGYVLNDSWGSSECIENCGFYGAIEGTNASAQYISGFVGYCDLSTFSIRNSVFAGELNLSSTNYVTAFGTYNKIYSSTTYTKNLYYVEDSTLTTVAGAKATSSPLTSAIHAVSEEVMASGEIAYILNGKSSANAVWKQTLATDGAAGEAYPSFKGGTVYYVYDGGCTDATYNWIYSNENVNTETHFYTEGLCAFNQDASNKYVVNVSCPCGNQTIATFTVVNETNLIYDGTTQHTVKIEAWYADGVEEFAIDATQKIYTYSEEREGDYKAPENGDLSKAGFYKVLVTVTDGTNNALAEYNYEVKKSSVTYVYTDYDGTALGSETGYIDADGNALTKPAGISNLNKVNEYYTYTFNHWLGEDGTEYATLPDFNDFDAENTEVTVNFKAVYDIAYNKVFHLVGEIENQVTHSNIYNRNVLTVEEGMYVSVITSFAIQTNGGVASILLIPNYEKSLFDITGISVNGQLIWGEGAVSEEVLSGWVVDVTGTEVTTDVTKILLENKKSGQTGSNFIQIIYTSKAVSGLDETDFKSGTYDFGFVTADYKITTEDELSHNDRSEAYGIMSKEGELLAFNELQIIVDKAAVTVVVRQHSNITMEKDTIVYDGNAAQAVGDHADGVSSEDNTFQYCFEGHLTELIGGIEHNWLQYITIKWYNADGTEQLTSAPTEAGYYQIWISVAQTAHFYAINDMKFDVEIKPYVISVDAVVNNPSKVYNGNDGVEWGTSDITFTPAIAGLNGDKGYSVTLENNSYVNAGTYYIDVVFTATANYCFGEADGKYITTYTLDGDKLSEDDNADNDDNLKVQVTPYALTITVSSGLNSVYGDALMALNPEGVNNRKYMFSATGTTADVNKQIPIAVKDVSDGELAITLTKADGLSVGQYVITVTHSQNFGTDADGNAIENYDITVNNAQKYTIVAREVLIPTIADLIYNGTEQTPAPTLADGYQFVKADDDSMSIVFVNAATGKTETVYSWSGDAQKNVGNYTWNATLVSTVSFKWELETGNTPTALREIAWNITPASLTITISDVEREYGDDLVAADVIYTATGLKGDDSITNIGLGYYLWNVQGEGDLAIGQDVDVDGRGHYPVGNYTIVGTYSGSNYDITWTNGKYTVTQKELSGDSSLSEIIAMITGATKYYTGEELEWLLADFTLDGTIDGVEIENIIEIIGIEGLKKKENTVANAWINANGKLSADGTAWTYYEPKNQLYYVVSIRILDEAMGSYVLYMNGEEAVTADDVDVEVRIAQATNDWKTSPSVTGSNATNLVETSEAYFGNPATVTYYSDSTLSTPIDKANVHAGIHYWVQFVIAETNNYTGLSTVYDFNTDYLTTLLPTAYVDNSTLIVPKNGSYAITYDGLMHFIKVASGEYTITVSTSETYSATGIWKDAGGVYYITLKLNQDYSWSGVADDESTTEVDESIAPVTFTLVINKAALTITADNQTVTYRGDAPAYTAKSAGWQNGEGYTTYLADFDIATYITSEYVAGTTGYGTYDIVFVDNAETTLEGILTNYDVTLAAGTLTVNKLTLNFNNMTGALDDNAAISWADLIANGFSVEYNAQQHSVTVNGYPAELVPTIAYTLSGSAATPLNAGTYTVTVTFTIADDYDEDNFTWTNPESVTLTITKVALKATTAEQKATFTGEEVGLPVTDIQKAIEQGLFALTFSDGRTGNPMDTAFIASEVTLNYLHLRTDVADYNYIDARTYEKAVYVSITFSTNFTMEYENGDFVIYKGTLTWAEELWTKDRDYNGVAIVVNTDYLATIGDGGDQTKVTYRFYNALQEQLGEGQVPIDAGTYYIMAFYDDGVHAQLHSGYVKIEIFHAKIVISVEDIKDHYYLENIVINAVADDIDDPATGYSTVIEYFVAGEWTNVAPTAVGTYDVRVSVENLDLLTNYKSVIITGQDEDGNTTYEDAEYAYAELTIEAAQVKFEYKDGNGAFIDVVTDGKYAYWKNPTSTIAAHGGVDLHKYCGETCNLTFEYTVTDENGNAIAVVNARTLAIDFGSDTTTEYWGFELTTTGKFTITVNVTEAGAETNEDGYSKNFIGNKVETDSAYSVEFKDSALGHTKNEKEIIDFANTYKVATVYLFEGTKNIDLPTFSGDIEITGYTFRGYWTLEEGSKVMFSAFTDGIAEDTILWAIWDINKYTVTWYNYDGKLIYADDQVEYLADPVYDQLNKGKPEKAADDEYQYTWDGWSVVINGEKATLDPVTGNISYYAYFIASGREYTVTFIWGVDGKLYDENDNPLFTKTITNVVFGEDLSNYITLDTVTWFRANVWYTDEAMTKQVTTVQARDITLYGSYMFDIGNGDVNASGTVTTDDITLYRQWIVGGYKMTEVESGSEWATVTAEGFSLVDENGTPIKYFLKRVADVNADTSADIRDITTIRMSLVGGYGYGVGTGVEIAKVSGQAVVTSGGTNPGITETKVTYTVEDTEEDGITVTETVITVDNTVEEIVIEVGNLPANYVSAGFTATVTQTVEGAEVAVDGVTVTYADGKITISGLNFTESFTYIVKFDLDGANAFYGEQTYTVEFTAESTEETPDENTGDNTGDNTGGSENTDENTGDNENTGESA